MSRSTFTIPYKCTLEEAQERVTTLLRKKGYKEKILKNGEKVWKKGSGLLTAMQFIKPEYSDKAVILSGWIQAGLGAIGGKEMNLSGFVGGLPKKLVLNVIEEIKTMFI